MKDIQVQSLDQEDSLEEYRARKAEKQEEQRRRVAWEKKYENKFFYWVEDETLDAINDDINSIRQQLSSFESDYTYTFNSLENALHYYEYADYTNDEMDEMKSEVEDARSRLEDIQSNVSEIQKKIELVYEKLATIPREGMWGDDIIRLEPYMMP